jgi:hypothetical protein
LTPKNHPEAYIIEKAFKSAKKAYMVAKARDILGERAPQIADFFWRKTYTCALSTLQWLQLPKSLRSRRIISLATLLAISVER